MGLRTQKQANLEELMPSPPQAPSTLWITLGVLSMLPLLFVLFMLAGCQTKPTVARDNPVRKMESAERLMEPIAITPETVVVDARPRFDYSMAHIPRSISLQWSDFSEPEPTQRGVLQNDLYAITRRLARLGIGPGSHVVVVGRGSQGEGEEGRIAWMLAFLGVSRVQFADLAYFKVNMTNVMEDPAAKSAPIWKPEPIASLNVTRDEMQKAINKRAVERPMETPYSGEPVLYRFIDVRGGRDYLGREGFGAEKQVPNMDATNIPWKEFFTKGLRPDPSIREKLEKAGIGPQHRIIVFDQLGVSSAAVTLALRGMGYDKAGNYAGGLTDLMSAYGR